MLLHLYEDGMQLSLQAFNGSLVDLSLKSGRGE